MHLTVLLKLGGNTMETLYDLSRAERDLESRDFPGKGIMSFHDYIVQEDLKKLAREKRQGLGN